MLFLYPPIHSSSTPKAAGDRPPSATNPLTTSTITAIRDENPAVVWKFSREPPDLQGVNKQPTRSVRGSGSTSPPHPIAPAPGRPERANPPPPLGSPPSPRPRRAAATQHRPARQPGTTHRTPSRPTAWPPGRLAHGSRSPTPLADGLSAVAGCRTGVAANGGTGHGRQCLPAPCSRLTRGHPCRRAEPARRGLRTGSKPTRSRRPSPTLHSSELVPRPTPGRLNAGPGGSGARQTDRAPPVHRAALGQSPPILTVRSTLRPEPPHPGPSDPTRARSRRGQCRGCGRRAGRHSCQWTRQADAAADCTGAAAGCVGAGLQSTCCAFAVTRARNRRVGLDAFLTAPRCGGDDATADPRTRTRVAAAAGPVAQGAAGRRTVSALRREKGRPPGPAPRPADLSCGAVPPAPVRTAGRSGIMAGRHIGGCGSCGGGPVRTGRPLPFQQRNRHAGFIVTCTVQQPSPRSPPHEAATCRPHP